MYTKDLFKDTLVSPVKEGFNTLKIVSGYASSLMAIRHFEYLKRQNLLNDDFNLSLIIGMTSRDGIDKFNHHSFINLCNDIERKGNFQCRYVNSIPPVHSKIYVWCNGESPEFALLGSANYSQFAFSNNSREILAQIDQDGANDYYSQIYDHTIDCRDLDKNDEHVKIFERQNVSGLINPEAEENIFNETVANLEKVTLTLTKSNGKTPARSGLNWGQREGRDPNQAYINIPAPIRRKNFFPERGHQFLIITDDGKELVCVRAQDGGKGLHTTNDNSRMGEYFRYRMGLANGSYIEVSDLLEYGRTDVDLFKIDEETYLMDFSVKD